MNEHALAPDVDPAYPVPTRRRPVYGRHYPTTRWQSTTHTRPSLHERVQVQAAAADRQAIAVIEQARPPALRMYDQIPMRGDDLLYQVKLIAPLLARCNVAFIGDYDSTSALLGLLSATGGPCPAHMLVLDFDERVLAAVQTLARHYGFADRLEARRYNVFEPVPRDLVGQCDWFYTNPPYGSHNNGASARLFITRGCELTRRDAGGCIILPDDPDRPWTRRAMMATQQFLTTHNWLVREKFDDMHQYHLDDDRDLASSLLLVDHVTDAYGVRRSMPYAARRVKASEIPSFYGRDVTPPYPVYIAHDGHDVGAALS